MTRPTCMFTAVEQVEPFLSGRQYVLTDALTRRSLHACRYSFPAFLSLPECRHSRPSHPYPGKRSSYLYSPDVAIAVPYTRFRLLAIATRRVSKSRPQSQSLVKCGAIEYTCPRPDSMGDSGFTSDTSYVFWVFSSHSAPDLIFQT
jgi:hypothetical protein